MVDVFIGLGSNLGDRERMIWRAVDRIAEHAHIHVVGVSTLLNTAPLGPVAQGDFMNAVAHLQTDLKPLELLDFLLEVERRLGRTRAEKWGPRLIDLDILLYGKETVSDPRLQVPHPEMFNRDFVVAGLEELHAERHTTFKAKANGI